ncbi:MAG: DUF542 domain-containing protein [Acidimicrobiales bacterium]
MDSNPTLATLVNENPAAAAILDRCLVDSCCGGGRGLREACASRGIDVEQVLAELVATPRGPESRT